MECKTRPRRQETTSDTEQTPQGQVRHTQANEVGTVENQATVGHTDPTKTWKVPGSKISAHVGQRKKRKVKTMRMIPNLTRIPKGSRRDELVERIERLERTVKAVTGDLKDTLTDELDGLYDDLARIDQDAADRGSFLDAM